MGTQAFAQVGRRRLEDPDQSFKHLGTSDPSHRGSLEEGAGQSGPHLGSRGSFRLLQGAEAPPPPLLPLRT